MPSFGLITEGGIRTSTSTHTADDGCVVAMVAVQHEGRFLGILGMRKPDPPFFIASQEYVVQAIAFEIAEQLEKERRSEEDAVPNTEGIDLIARLRLLESVVVNANDSILITEAEPVELPGPRILYANPAFTRTTGYSAEEVLGKSPRILQGPLTDPEAPARIHAALKAWESIEVELLNYRKDGSTFWVELSISPVCDAKGWYTHWVSVQRDMTERKALQALPVSTLARPRILLATAEPTMQEHIASILGFEYQIEIVSTPDEALYSASNSLPDLILFDLVGSPELGLSLIESLKEDARTATLPVILITSRVEGETRSEGAEIDANDYLAKPFSSREIRARVRTQIELQTLKREIAAKEEFIRTTEALRQAEKLAVVGRLASSIAHEINNPLEAVTNLLYLAESDLGQSEAGQYVRQAQKELARASHIAIQTLGFHRQGLIAQKTALHEILDGMLSLFKGRPGTADLIIERQYRTRQPILAFEADLRQVFANLVSNAMDASTRGGKIILRVRDAVDPVTAVHGVRVLVADNGQGMSEETRKRIFDPFFTTKGMTGTGLGLWVSSEILRSHKAKVQVRSNQTPNRHGTVFSIFFPHA